MSPKCRKVVTWSWNQWFKLSATHDLKEMNEQKSQNYGVYLTLASNFSVNDIGICFIGVAAFLVIKAAEYISTGIVWCKSNVAYAYISY